MSEVEIHDQAKQYLDRASNFRRNFEEFIREGEFAKASEMLWGIFTCLVNIISLYRTGKTISEHKLVVQFAKELAKTLSVIRLEKAI